METGPAPVWDCYEGPPAKLHCLSSAASDCSMSDETIVTPSSLSGGVRSHRKPGDCRRLWHSEWGTVYLVLYDDKSDKCVCLKCNKTLETVKKYSLQRHYECNHPHTEAWSTKKNNEEDRRNAAVICVNFQLKLFTGGIQTFSYSCKTPQAA